MGLGVDVGALVHHGGQFVESVGQQGGVEREGERKVGGSGGDVEMVACLEVGDLFVEWKIGRRHYKRPAGKVESRADLCRGATWCARAEIEINFTINQKILGNNSVRSLQRWRSVDEVKQRSHKISQGESAVGIRYRKRNRGAVGFCHKHAEDAARDVLAIHGITTQPIG